MAARGKTDVTVSMPTVLLRKLDRLVKLQGVTRSDVVTELLSAGLEGGEAMVKVLANDKVRAAMVEAFMKPGVLRAMTLALGSELSPDDGQKLLEFFRDASSPGPGRERPPFSPSA